MRMRPVLPPKTAEDDSALGDALRRSWAARALRDLCDLLGNPQTNYSEIQALAAATVDAAAVRSAGEVQALAVELRAEASARALETNDGHAGWRAGWLERLQSCSLHTDLSECSSSAT